MSYILVESLTKTFSDRIILNSVDFAVNEGEKIALVAKNGAGKSTLLKILTGKEPYDSGRITAQKGIKIGFLEQEPLLDSGKTAHEELFASESHMIRAVKLYEESLEDPRDKKKMTEAYEAMNVNNAWEYEKKIRKILKKLKIFDLKGKISTFSGGQAKRVTLAKVLIDSPDFLIMDEPTNHLDLEMIEWLENYLIKRELTLLMVTHDRYFLERVCDRILELDEGTIYRHKGNYTYYLEKKAHREKSENTGIDRTQSLLKKELAWMKKQPRGRQTKSKARIDAYYKLRSGIKKKNVVEKVKLDVEAKRLGAKVLEVHNLSKSFGGKVILDKFTYSFKRNEKIGVIGSNGAGKTTFLNLLMGYEKPDSGKIVRGETVKFSYYSQYQENFDENDTVINNIKNIAPYAKLSGGKELSASKMLERFLFGHQAQQNTISELSGGERRRLSLLRTLMSGPNFLLLDEPTNDFDLVTLNVLEEFLHEFKGCLIIVTHDRYFMDRIVDHLFVFKGEGAIQDFPGNYSEYRESYDFNKTPGVNDPEINTSNVPAPVNMLDKEARKLYREISKLESRKAKLSEKVFDTELDFDEIGKIVKKIEELEREIGEKSDRWLELSV